MDVEGASDVPESKQEEMDVDVTDTENQQPLKQDQNKNKSERSKQHPDGKKHFLIFLLLNVFLWFQNFLFFIYILIIDTAHFLFFGVVAKWINTKFFFL